MCVCVCVCVCVYSKHAVKSHYCCISYPPVGIPQITQHPTPQKDVVPGSLVNFTVTATGGGDLTCKRGQDGADLGSLPEGMSGETPCM